MSFIIHYGAWLTALGIWHGFLVLFAIPWDGQRALTDDNSIRDEIGTHNLISDLLWAEKVQFVKEQEAKYLE